MYTVPIRHLVGKPFPAGLLFPEIAPDCLCKRAKLQEWGAHRSPAPELIETKPVLQKSNSRIPCASICRLCKTAKLVCIGRRQAGGVSEGRAVQSAPRKMLSEELSTEPSLGVGNRTIGREIKEGGKLCRCSFELGLKETQESGPWSPQSPGHECPPLRSGR